MKRSSLLVCALLAWPPGVAFAHGLAPILVRVEEPTPGEVRVRWTVSTTGTGMGLAADGTPLRLRLPEHCEPLATGASGDGPRFRTTEERFRCAGGLGGTTLRIEGLAQSRQPLVLRYRGPDGAEHARTLAGADDRIALPEAGAPAASPWQSFGRYVGLGVEHILLGWDHLAFVLCLAVLAGGVRRLLWAVTSFTLAHSVTLALATLGVLQVPGPPVEACIALSVLFVAVRAVGGEAGPAPPGVGALSASAFAFGLLHGLGFAGALSDVGFAGVSLAAGLAGFNLGVELGQVLVLAALGLLALGVERGVGWPVAVARARRLAVEVAGVAAAYWLIERALSFAPA